MRKKGRLFNKGCNERTGSQYDTQHYFRNFEE